MKYQGVIVTQRCGPEVLQVIENELRPPTRNEVRIRVLATGVGGTDINYRYGLSPFAPKVPFVPGYEIMGIVDAMGEDVKRAAAGDRVAALTGHGDHALSILRRGGKLVAYAAPVGLLNIVKDTFNLIRANLFSGKKAEFYGITALYLRDRNPFMEDLPKLFQLLEEGKIKPVIMERLSLLDAKKANELLESGKVIGNVVLLALELL